MQHHPEIERNVIRALPQDLSDIRILDVGCGKGYWGAFLRAQSGGENAEVHGIDVHRPYLDTAEKQGVYDKVFLGDLTDPAMSSLEPYDLVLCFDVLEHLPKPESVKLLEALESLAVKSVIVSTPNGFQARDAFGDNPHSAHLCGWTAREFKMRGYRVEGLGFIGEPRDHNARFWYPMHYGLTPFTRRMPRFANTLIALKAHVACS